MTQLPSFNSPPVGEVACAIQFADALPVGIVELLAIRNEFIDDFPVLEEHPPLPPLGHEGAVYQMPVEGGLSPRLWFTSATGNDVVQIQRDRLGINWRRMSDEDEYPRYDSHFRPTVVRCYERLVDGLLALGIEEPKLSRFELIYVNPISLQPGDTYTGVLQLIGSTRGFLPEPDGLQVQLMYPLPDIADGALFIDARSARRTDDESPSVLTQLIVRGSTSDAFSTAMATIDTAREWIVRGFADVTTTEMHERWGRTT